MYVLTVILPDSSVLQIAVYMDNLKVVAWYGTPNHVWYSKYMGQMKTYTWYTLNIFYDKYSNTWKFSYAEVDPETRQSIGQPVIVSITDLIDNKGQHPNPPLYTHVDASQLPLIVESYSYNETLWKNMIYFLHLGICVFTTESSYPSWYWCIHGYLYTYCINNSPDYGTENSICGGGIVPNWIYYTFGKESDYWKSNFYIGPYELDNPIDDAGKQLY